MTIGDFLPDTYVATILAAIFLVGGTARVVRLITADTFPPAVWLRIKWQAITKDGEWSVIAECPWCLPPYILAPNAAWALLSDYHWSWWMFNIFMTFIYIVSWLVFHDED